MMDNNIKNEVFQKINNGLIEITRVENSGEKISIILHENNLIINFDVSKYNKYEPHVKIIFDALKDYLNGRLG